MPSLSYIHADADATIRGAADADAIIRAGITGGAQGSLFIAIVGTAGLLLYLFDYIHTECKKKLNTNTTGKLNISNIILLAYTL